MAKDRLGTAIYQGNQVALKVNPESPAPNPETQVPSPGSNGIATAADFQKQFELQADLVRLVLPQSGLPVLARRLTPMRVLLTAEAFDRLGPASDSPSKVEYARLVTSTIREILIKPRLALNPSLEEIDPNWVPKEDSDFLFRWGMGLVSADGTDLAQAFRDARACVPAPGANGGGLRDAAEQLRRDRESHGGDAV
jgi:hypothetical protein